MNIRIFEDIYWKEIYDELHHIFPDMNFPIKWNTDSPSLYMNEIKDWDFIILDNYFRYEWKQEPLWSFFLREYLRQNKNAKIIWISNYWEILLKKFERWMKAYSKWDIIWFVPTKNATDIAELIIKELSKEKKTK